MGFRKGFYGQLWRVGSHEDLETRPTPSVRSITTVRPLLREWLNALLPLLRLSQRWRCFRHSHQWALANMLRSD
ncbi:hypothetical protein LMG6871_04836 [Ralstonia edaphis]|nr:hypothetical protein LMG6871_04836 [Ralstonia sp. LMG 6871]